MMRQDSALLAMRPRCVMKGKISWIIGFFNRFSFLFPWMSHVTLLSHLWIQSSRRLEGIYSTDCSLLDTKLGSELTFLYEVMLPIILLRYCPGGRSEIARLFREQQNELHGSQVKVTWLVNKLSVSYENRRLCFVGVFHWTMSSATWTQSLRSVLSISPRVVSSRQTLPSVFCSHLISMRVNMRLLQHKER
jgi:hypothetical protein